MKFFTKISISIVVISVLFIVNCHLYHYHCFNSYGPEEKLFAYSAGSVYNDMYFLKLFQNVIIPASLVSILISTLLKNICTKKLINFSIFLSVVIFCFSVENYTQQLLISSIFIAYFLATELISFTQEKIDDRMKKYQNSIPRYESQDSKNQFA